MNNSSRDFAHRFSGILLHPASLPSPYGIGDFGPAALDWIAALSRAKQRWWQILPLGPTGYGDSPYQSFSSFAGNVNLLSPDALVEDGLLKPSDVGPTEQSHSQIDYAKIIPMKHALLRICWSRFAKDGPADVKAAFAEFRKREAHWLDDFVLFMAIKDSEQGRAWNEWPRELACRDTMALRRMAGENAGLLDEYRFGQFLFFRQWGRIREHAKARGIQIIGDLPIFVAYDSVDVWARPDLFLLDEQLRPRVVAGVPPDYFSATGQLWGNPLYDWAAHRREGYSWWIKRFKAVLRLVDLVRLDHFRGFQAYWEVPAGDATAARGRWAPGPGEDFLATLRHAVGGLPLIAEDLGFITPEVDALRQKFDLPGMRILQFAFGGTVESRFLPHNLERNVVVYTGTHDNDTTVGWHQSLTDAEREHFYRYVPGVERDPAWGLIRLAWASVARLAVAPLQDVLRLDATARMNRPGTATGNWRWRFEREQLSPQILDDLAELTETYERSG